MPGKVKFLDDQSINPLVKEDKVFQAALDEFSSNSFAMQVLKVECCALAYQRCTKE